MTLVRGLLAWAGDGEGGARWRRSRCGGPDGACATRCTAACPTQALAWRDDLLQVEDGCDACGLCATACPREALTVESVNRSLEEARRRKTAAYWFCERVPPASRRSGGACVACLGALPLEGLVNLVAVFNQPIFLQAGPCEECLRGPAYSLAKPRLTGLAQYLERAAERPVLVFGTPPAESKESPSGLSRRAFFSALRGSVAAVIPDPEADSESDTRPGRELQRGNLLAVLKKLSGGKPLPEGGADVLPALLLPQVEEKACTLCGRCALACIPGALSMRASQGHLTLGLEADRCTGCAACAESCARSALTLSETLEATETTARLASACANLCLRCGRPFPEPISPSMAQCPSCTSSALRRAEFAFPGYSRPA